MASVDLAGLRYRIKIVACPGIPLRLTMRIFMEAFQELTHRQDEHHRRRPPQGDPHRGQQPVFSC
jgi:hypothetical protein